MEGGEGRGGREGRGGGGWGKRGEGLASPAPASRSPAARRRRIGCVRGREFPRRRAVECFQMGTECFQSGLVSISCHGPPLCTFAIDVILIISFACIIINFSRVVWHHRSVCIFPRCIRFDTADIIGQGFRHMLDNEPIPAAHCREHRLNMAWMAHGLAHAAIARVNRAARRLP